MTLIWTSDENCLHSLAYGSGGSKHVSRAPVLDSGEGHNGTFFKRPGSPRTDARPNAKCAVGHSWVFSPCIHAPWKNQPICDVAKGKARVAPAGAPLVATRPPIALTAGTAAGSQTGSEDPCLIEKTGMNAAAAGSIVSLAALAEFAHSGAVQIAWRSGSNRSNSRFTTA